MADKGGGRWWIVALVFAAVMLNYVDRQILALLKPTLEARFRWSDGDYGNMQAAFQLAAAFGFLGAGWFIDRVGLRLGFGLGVLVWSLAGMGHAFASGVTSFIGARVVLGVAESVGTPGAVKSAATYFGARERSLALGIGNTAPNVGAIVTPLFIPALAVAFGWRAAFLTAGGLGLLWAIAWFGIRVRPVAVAAEQGARVPWAALLRDRRTLAIAAAKILSDQVWFFMLSWVPDMFHRLFGLQQGQLGWPVALVYLLAAMGALTGGWLPTRLLAAGWSLNAARKTAMLVYAVMIVPVPVVLSLHDPWAAAVVLGLGLFAHQGFSTNVFGLATDIVPARAVGSTIGIAAFCGNVWSIGLIKLPAWSIAHGLGYWPVLLICAGSYLAALGIVQLILPRIERAEEEGSGMVVAH